MARSKESLDYAKQRKQLWGTVVYPTEDFFYKYLNNHNLIKSYTEQGEPLDENGQPFYNGSDGWGEFDEKDYNYILDSLVCCLISPLHYLDIDYEEESQPYKKPHFHIMFIYDSVKSYNQVLPFFQEFHGVGAKGLDSRRMAARYLCHLDHPHKALYNKEDVITVGGLNYYELINSVSDTNTEVALMIDYIVDNHIFSFSQFLRICKLNFPEWFTILCNSKSYIIDRFIKGYTWELENMPKLKELQRLALDFNSEKKE